MVRLGFYIENYVVGGTERYLVDLMMGLDPSRYEIILLSNPNPAFRRYLEQRGAGGFLHREISILPPTPHFAPSAKRQVEQTTGSMANPKTAFRDSIKEIAKGLWRYATSVPNLTLLTLVFRSYHLDILHIINGGYPAAETCRLAVLAAGLTKTPCVMTVHSPAGAPSWPSALERVFDRMIAKRLGKIITSAVSTAQSLHNMREMPNQLMQPIDLGIEPALMRTPASSDDGYVRTQFGIPQTAIVVGLVGRFDWYKGHRYLLEAASIVMDSSEGSDFYLLFVGDGNELLSMKSLADTLGIANRVVFTGFYSDVLAAIRACDIMTMLSVGYESQGYVTLEAMGQERPIIASNVCGLGEVVVDGVTGLLVPPADSNALADALRQMIRDEPKRLSMGKAGRHRLDECFTLSRMLTKTQIVYEEMLVGKSAE